MYGISTASLRRSNGTAGRSLMGGSKCVGFDPQRKYCSSRREQNGDVQLGRKLRPGCVYSLPRTGGFLNHEQPPAYTRPYLFRRKKRKIRSLVQGVPATSTAHGHLPAGFSTRLVRIAKGPAGCAGPSLVLQGSWGGRVECYQPILNPMVPLRS